jgi:alpha-D-ribose 1-methylphosphonate 5-triphosphate synthase subunit PhnH
MLDLGSVGAGFADPVADSQSAFRRCLAALSRPGTIVDCGDGVETPATVHAAANALLLTLVDQDCRLWLSAGLSNAAAAHLRFHTGCRRVGDAELADFALVASPSELPSLESFAAGSHDYPDRSATVVVQLAALAAKGPWRLTGPGIREEARLFACGLGAPFVAEWARNARRFPCGVDLFLVSGARLCGLPRTTHIDA